MIPRYVPAHTLRDVVNVALRQKEKVLCPAFIGNSSRLVLPVESASAGLKMVLLALGIKGRVVLPTYTCILVPDVVASCGCEPVFVDVSLAHGTVMADTLKQFAPGDIAAIIATHMHGIPCDIVGIMEQAQRLGALVIEDCALAMGSRISDLPVGSFAPVAIFSTGRGKTVNFGGGGLLVINELVFAEKVKSYWLQYDRPIGFSKKYLTLVKLMLGTREGWALVYPIVSRLKRLIKGTWFWERSLRHEVTRSPTELRGYVSMVLPSLIESLDIERQFVHRRLIGRIYCQNIIDLPGRLHKFNINPEHDVVWPSFPLWVCERDELFLALRRKGIDCGLTFSYSAAVVFSGESNTNAEKIAENIITLPVHVGVSEQQAITIADWVNECSNKYKIEDDRVAI